MSLLKSDALAMSSTIRMPAVMSSAFLWCQETPSHLLNDLHHRPALDPPQVAEQPQEVPRVALPLKCQLPTNKLRCL